MSTRHYGQRILLVMGNLLSIAGRQKVQPIASRHPQCGFEGLKGLKVK